VAAGSGLRLLSQALEPMPGNRGVMSGVLGISVTQVVLHGAQVGALIGQVVAARMAQHVRPDATELRGLVSNPHGIVKSCARVQLVYTDVANVGPRPTPRTRATISSERAEFGGSAVCLQLHGYPPKMSSCRVCADTSAAIVCLWPLS
jgi:hypothetical protein